jgi:hypothetical protein
MFKHFTHELFLILVTNKMILFDSIVSLFRELLTTSSIK